MNESRIVIKAWCPVCFDKEVVKTLSVEPAREYSCIHMFYNLTDIRLEHSFGTNLYLFKVIYSLANAFF